MSVCSSVNKTKVLHGIPRDPDIAAALAELEMEEEANNEPKVWGCGDQTPNL